MILPFDVLNYISVFSEIQLFNAFIADEMAKEEARSLTLLRSPSSISLTAYSPFSVDTPTYTVPTGVCSVPPPGPAIPVVETATSAPERSRTPFAICFAVSSETTPCFSMVSRFCFVTALNVFGR